MFCRNSRWMPLKKVSVSFHVLAVRSVWLVLPYDRTIECKNVETKGVGKTNFVLLLKLMNTYVANSVFLPRRAIHARSTGDANSAKNYKARREHPRRLRSSHSGREKRRNERFKYGRKSRAWKLSSRLFSRPDWLLLSLRGCYTRNFFPVCSANGHSSPQNLLFLLLMWSWHELRHQQLCGINSLGTWSL